MHARGLGHAVDLDHRQLELVHDRLPDRDRNGRAAARGIAQAGDVGCAWRHGERCRQHRRHARQRLRPVAGDQAPDVAHRIRIAPAGAGEHDEAAARRKSLQRLRQRAADVEQRHAEQQGAAGLGFQDEVDRPGLVDLVAMAVSHQLRRARGAAGVEIGRGVAGLDLPATDEVIRGLRLDQVVEGVDAVRRITAAAIHLHDRLEVLEATAHLLDLLPDVGAGQGTERHQHLGLGGLQDLGDLVRLQQRVDRVGDASGLCAEQRGESFRHQGQHEADDVIGADAERMKHVGGLRHLRDEIAIGDHDRRVGRIGIWQELDRRRVRIGGSPAFEGLVGALCGDAFAVRRLLEGADVSGAGECRIIAADGAIEQMNARHGLSSLCRVLVRPDMVQPVVARGLCAARSSRS